MADVEAALAGGITGARRRELAADAMAALDRLSRAGLLKGVTEVEIFGSFVSAKEEPGDVDLLLHYDDLDPEAVREVDGLYGPGRHGRVTIVAIDAGPDGDAFRSEYRAGTVRRHGVATVRVYREP